MTQPPTTGFDAELAAGQLLFRLLLAPRRDQIATAQAAVCAAAAQLGFAAEARGRLELAMEEAVSNVLDHAYACGDSKPIEIEARVSAAHLELAVRDRGLPFDPERAPRFSRPQVLDEASAEGLGLFLIRAMTDEARFRNLGREGKELLLRKRLPAAVFTPGGERAGKGEGQPFGEAPPELRALRRGEAVAVARLLYEAHDFSFPFEEFFRPEQLEALIEAGQLDCLVAESGGRILGHLALRRDPLLPGGRMVAAVVVQRSQRRRGIAGGLLQAAVALAQRRGWSGLCAEAVTAHPAAQRLFARAGFLACSLLPAYSAPLQFRGSDLAARPRESLVLLYRPLQPRPAGLGYVPPALAPLIASLLHRLGPGIEIASADQAPRLAGPDVSEARLIDALSTLQLLVHRPGTDSLQRLTRALDAARRNRVAVVEVLLPLLEPATPYLAEALLPLGLHPVGLRPATAAGDTLVLLGENGWPVSLADLPLDDPVMRLLATRIEGRRAKPGPA